MNQTSGELALTHHPDLKSEVVGQSNCFPVLFPSYSNHPPVETPVPSEVDEAVGITDMSLCSLISIWLRLSIIRVQPNQLPCVQPPPLFHYNHPHSYIHRCVCSVHFQMVQSDIKGGGVYSEVTL